MIMWNQIAFLKHSFSCHLLLTVASCLWSVVLQKQKKGGLVQVLPTFEKVGPQLALHTDIFTCFKRNSDMEWNVKFDFWKGS